MPDLISTYSHGSFVTLNGGEIVKLWAIHPDLVIYQAFNGIQDHCRLVEIKPLEITPEVLHKTGFELIENRQEILHIKMLYAIRINGKNEFLRGVIYKNKSVWVFNGFTVHYFHILQHLLSAMDTEYRITLF